MPRKEEEDKVKRRYFFLLGPKEPNISGQTAFSHGFPSFIF